jgi:hemerythrin-like metal-binding protein
MINELHAALEAVGATGKIDKKNIGMILRRIHEHSTEHFEREELYFFQTGYPCQESHRLEHCKLIEKIAKMTVSFHDSTSPKDATEIMQSICDWITGHFFVTDRKYSFHFHAHQIF